MEARHGYKWTIPEILQLQREYELLHLSFSDIASLHDRSENAIIAKVEQEKFQREHVVSQKIFKDDTKSTAANLLDDELFMAIIGFCIITVCARAFTILSDPNFHFISPDI